MSTIDEPVQELLASNILAQLSSTNVIPATSVDLVSLTIRRARGNTTEILKTLKLDDSSKLSSLGSLVAQVEAVTGSDISTCCAIILTLSERSSDILQRRKMRDIVSASPLGEWSELFKQLAIAWTKSDPFEESIRLTNQWSNAKQTGDIEVYIAREQDLFEQISSYCSFAGVQVPTNQDRVTNLLKGLKTNMKFALSEYLRGRMQRTEIMTYEEVLEAILVCHARQSINYSWAESTEEFQKKPPRTYDPNSSGHKTLCTSCKRSGHLAAQCWSTHPELKPGPLPPRSPQPSDSKHQIVKCGDCGIVGHTADRCWKTHPELRPVPSPPVASATSQSPRPPSELAPKATSPYQKPITRADTAAARSAPAESSTTGKRQFAVIPQEHRTENLAEELVIMAFSNTTRVSMFIDTLSYYSICSNKDVEKLNGKFDPLDRPISVQTFEGKSYLTGRAILPLSFRVNEEVCHEFELVVYTVDRSLSLGSETPSLILGLSSLQRMGANIRLHSRDIVFTKLSYVCLPLSNKNLIRIPEYIPQRNSSPKFDQCPALFEMHVGKMADAEMLSFIQQKLLNWVPLEAECRLKENTPTQHHQGYPVPPTEVENMQKMIVGLVEEGVLIPTIPTPDSFISPAFLRPKGDGGRRLLVNMKPLNDCQVIAQLDLSCSMTALLQIDNETNWFASVDISSAFHSVKYKDNLSRRLHTIKLLGSYYEFSCCVQGDVNSPAYWAKHLEGILVCGLGVGYTQWVIPYVDDILVHALTEESCRTRFRFLKTLLTAAGKKISHENGPTQQLSLCGMEFSQFGWRMSQESRETLSNLINQIPTDFKSLRSALGSINYLKSGFGYPNKSLSALTDEFYTLLSECEKSGKKNPQLSIEPELWRALINGFDERFLSFRKFPSHTRYAITTDASDHYCGGALFALPDTADEPFTSDILLDATLVDIFSKRFSKSERNWPIFERESLSIVIALQRWAGLLWSSPSEHHIVFTDSLVAMTQWQNLRPPERVQSQRRWLAWYGDLCLYEMDRIQFRHISGEVNTLADLLSRICGEINDPNAQAKCFVTLPTSSTLDEIRRLQSEFPIENLEKNKQDFVLVDGCVCYQDFHCIGPADPNPVPFVPPGPLRLSLIKEVHDIGHLGWKATYTRLRENYYWPECQVNVKLFVKQCSTCALVRTEATTKIPDVLRKRKPCMDSFQNLFIDHFHGNECYQEKISLTIIDQFSGFVQFIEVVDETSETTVRALLSWISSFGFPFSLTTDRGPAFDSVIWKGICASCNIKCNFTSVQNPRANLAERPHRLLRSLCGVGEAKGTECLPWSAALAIGSLLWNTRRTTTPPCTLIFGKLLRDPFDVTCVGTPDGDDQVKADDDYAMECKYVIDGIKAIHRRSQMDEYLSQDLTTPLPLQVGDSVRLQSSADIGKIVEVGDWSAKILWQSGCHSWRNFGSLRKVDPVAAIQAWLIPPSSFCVLRHSDGIFAARIIEKKEDRILIEWYDNYGTASYAPLTGHEPEWVSMDSIVSYINLTSTGRLSEASRTALASKGVL